MNPHARFLFAIPLLAVFARPTPALADGGQPSARPTTLANPTKPAPKRHLAWTLGAAEIGSAGENGAAFTVGILFRPIRFLQTSVEFGYGLLDGARGPEDRWWVMPTLALVIPAGRMSFDLGGGVGSGTVSGYQTWPSYFAHPFDPCWHITEPAVRGHLGFSVPLTGSIDLWGRADVGTIVAPAPASDTQWHGLTIGVQGWLVRIDQTIQAANPTAATQELLVKSRPVNLYG
jgi:hypothetical protein